MFYRLRCDSDTYHSFKILSDNALEISKSLKGKPLLDTWKVVNIDICRMKKEGDFSSTLGNVIFTDKALKIMEPLIGNSIEVLPLKYKSKQYNLINVLALIPLDAPNSDVISFPDGRILDIKKYSFDKKLINKQHIFKVKEAPLLRPIVSEDFKKIVEANNLEGLIFEQVC